MEAKFFRKNSWVNPFWPQEERRNFGIVQNIAGWRKTKVATGNKHEQQHGAKSNAEM